MPNKDDSAAFVQWILDKVDNDPDAIHHFLSLGDVMNEALEHFNNDWIDYCEENPEEPEFPYQINILSEPEVCWEDDVETIFELAEGTLVNVLRKAFDTCRVCTLVGDTREFYLEIGEIQYGH